MTIAPEREASSAPPGPQVGCPSRRRAPSGAPVGDDRPQLADGVTLLGEYAGTGYVEPQYLASRGGGQQVQLSHLLHLVASACDGSSSYEQVAERVSGEYGKTVSADNVRALVEKLRPLGVLADAQGRSPEVEESDPLLGLKLRREVLRPATVQRLSALASPVFWPPVVLAVLAALAATDYWLFFVHGIGQGLRSTVQQPAVFLVVAATIVTSAALHELGHAAACRYSGAKPGGMGMGIYVVWPAFYTDVTDAYQLDRRGRLRTDLGGVYVNAIVVLVLGGLHVVTGFEPLVLMMFLLQIQVVQQMLPFLRLDGYYVVSDLVGVPDLFRRIGPVLRSAIPFRAPDKEVAELKRWVRWAVTGWVLVIVPVLALNLGYLLLAFPRIAATSWDSASRLVGQLGAGGAASSAWTGLQLLLLVLPAIGLTFTFSRIVRSSVRGALGWSRGSVAKRTLVVVGLGGAVVGLAVAWFPDGRVAPYRPGERGTVQQQVRELQTVGTGTPLLRTPQEAQQPLPAVPASSSAVTEPTTQPSPAASSSTSPSPGAGSASSPAPVADESSPTPSPVDSTLPSPTATPSASPSP